MKKTVARYNNNTGTAGTKGDKKKTTINRVEGKKISTTMVAPEFHEKPSIIF